MQSCIVSQLSILDEQGRFFADAQNNSNGLATVSVGAAQDNGAGLDSFELCLVSLIDS